MSDHRSLVPRRIERKITNHNGDGWDEYRGEPLFSDEDIERLYTRFRQMNETDWETIATVKGHNSHRTKIRTKDLDAFREELRKANRAWVAEHGPPLTTFGNTGYGEELTQAASTPRGFV